MKIDNVQVMSNNVFIFKKFKNIREYEKKIKMKLINFKMLIDLFHYFSSKKLINKNVNNLKSKHSSSNFNNDLIKTSKKIFRGSYNDFDKLLSFDNKNDASSTISHI